MNSENCPPFFIVGVHRSGTTLLRFMLSSSPRIYIPPESDFIPRFFLANPSADLSLERVGRLLDIIFSRYRFVGEWEGPRPDPAQFFSSMKGRSPADFLNTLYEQYARQKNACRWGDKTPIYSNYIDLLHTIFPDAKFVHILRDGRDVAVSMLEKWGARELHVDPYFAARNWQKRVRRAREAGVKLGDEKFLELRYEELVRQPERYLRTICAFLEEPFVPAMLVHHRIAREIVAEGTFHDPVRQPTHPGRIGRWRREMPPADVRLFQRVAGQLLDKLGYELVDSGPMPPGETLRYGALAAKYEILQAGRRVLQRFGLFAPI